MTSADLILLIIVAIGIAAAVGFVLFKKRAHRAKLTKFYEGAPVADRNSLTKASDWYLGPHPYGVNRSVGVPLNPEAGAEGPTFAIPVGNWDGPPDPINETPRSNTGGHVHAMSINYGSLTGKKLIRAKVRVDVPEGVSIAPHTAGPGAPAMMGLYFQEKGDDWSAGGDYEDYRWYTSFAEITPVVNGVFEIVAPLDGPWTATQTSSRAGNPQGFKLAVDNAQAIGLTFGGGSGLSHGFYATGPGARLTLLEFVVE